MNVAYIVEAAFLAFSVAAVVYFAIGMACMESVFDRLHCLGPAALLGPSSLAVAVLVRHSSAQAVIKVLLIVFVILLVSPILTHATAVAARIRERGEIGIDAANQGDAM